MLDFNSIQTKWQDKWKDLGNTKPSDKPKFFMIFAYPGISGYLHVGHMRGYSYTDAICRYKRMTGHNVLFPVGTHASGNQAIAFAKKVQNNDKNWIEYLKRNGCPEDLIPKLTTPEKIVDYFNGVYLDFWKKFGFLCDWERFTSTVYPDYNKFIQWQFKKLQDNNLLVQKPYFATACMNCGPVAVDASETDISKGGSAEKNEYVLLKFKFGDAYLLAATLRPETIYGQTNMWVNPDATYTKIKYENEFWIVSKQAAEKLSYQKDGIEIIEDIPGKNFVGKSCVAPGIDRELIILPSSFTNPDIGSGFVTSVPSDAPFDYIALEDIKKNKELQKKYNLTKAQLDIKLIPIIKSKGFDLYPAKEIVEKLKITSQEDKEKLEEATAEIYKVGFHTGVMRDNCGKYSGMKVVEAKELMKQDLLDSKKADIMYDLSEEVICRCGGKVIVKRIDDQWFIKYSDKNLTNKTKKHAKTMLILPEEYYNNIGSVLDWFQDRACARLGSWLGTKFDKKWTIEPISDSTLYPAYYIVSKFVNNKQLKPEQLTEEFFDYVYLGKGDSKKISESIKCKKELLEEVKQEFDYYYPLDINLGGKEHKTVHFPVFLMNHVGILPKDKWPKGIFINNWVVGKGTKISKSKGGAVPIPDAVENYGVDGMRLYYAHIGSPHTDIVWTEETVKSYRSTLEKIYLTCQIKLGEGNSTALDSWLESRLNSHIKNVTEMMEVINLRDSANIIYYLMHDDLKWYVRRGGANKELFQDYINSWTKLMCPITPHTAEEINSLFSKDLVSSSDWPSFDKKKINNKFESAEDMIIKTTQDMRQVLKLAKIETPESFTLFTSLSWKYDLFKTLKKELEETRDVGKILKTIMAKEELKRYGKDISKLVVSLAKDPSKIPDVITSLKFELDILEQSKTFLESEFNCKVNIIKADESQESKSKQAMPGKPAILVK